MALEGVDDIKSGDGLALGMLAVGDRVFDDGLEEGLQNLSGFIVDEGRNALDAASARQTSNGRLGDSHDGLAKFGFLCVSFGADLAVAFSSAALLSFSFCWHLF